MQHGFQIMTTAFLLVRLEAPSHLHAQVIEMVVKVACSIAMLFGPLGQHDGRFLLERLFQDLALFRVRRLGEGTGALALLDTCVAGSTPQTGKRELRAEELPLNEYRWLPIVFEHPGGNFETRVQWSGAASMAVDAIAVWAVMGDG